MMFVNKNIIEFSSVFPGNIPVIFTGKFQGKTERKQMIPENIRFFAETSLM